MIHLLYFEEVEKTHGLRGKDFVRILIDGHRTVPYHPLMVRKTRLNFSYTIVRKKSVSFGPVSFDGVHSSVIVKSGLYNQKGVGMEKKSVWTTEFGDSAQTGFTMHWWEKSIHRHSNSFNYKIYTLRSKIFCRKRAKFKMSSNIVMMNF